MLAALVPGFARAQAGGASDDATQEAVLTIGRVLVTGNVTTDSTRILRTFDVPVGARFNQDMVKRGTRKLAALGLFSDVRVLRAVHESVIDLTIEVRERPRLASIKFSGNTKHDNSDLEKKLFLKTGETYSATMVSTQIDSLLKYYHDEGFPRTKVTAGWTRSPPAGSA